MSCVCDGGGKKHKRCVDSAAGVCDDRGVRLGVHRPDLVRWLLLSLPGMAGTAALRKEALLCDR